MNKNCKHQWISIKDKLPVVGQILLFCNIERDHFLSTQTGFFSLVKDDESIEKNVFINFINNTLHENVSHWMPLPEPPTDCLASKVMIAVEKLKAVAGKAIAEEIEKLKTDSLNT